MIFWSENRVFTPFLAFLPNTFLAHRCFDKATTMTTTSDQEQARLLKQEGNNLFKAKKYKDAAARYRDAAHLDPQAVYYSNLAACHEKLSQWSKMETAAQKCIELDSQFVKGYYRLAVAQQQRQHWGDALATLQTGLTVAPNQADLVRLQAQVTECHDLTRCAHCNKPDAAMTCARCSVARYCNKECQREHFSQHKSTCRPPDLASMPSVCQKCAKTLSSRTYCSKCERMPYCSMDCLLQDWPRHKKECRQARATKEMVSARGKETFIALLDKWKEKTRSSIGLLATHGMTKRQFLQQPPSFSVLLDVRFNYNLLTFLPTAKPTTVPLDSLDESVRDAIASKIEQAMQLRGESNVVAHVIMLDAGDPGLDSTSIIPQNILTSGFQRYSWEDMLLMWKHGASLSGSMPLHWRSTLR